MNVLIFSYYSQRGGSSRYMIHDYLPYLQQAGIPYDIHPLLDDWYLAYILDKPPHITRLKLFLYLCQRYALRIKQLLQRQPNSLVLFDSALFPYLPYWFTQLFLRQPYVVTYDEAQYRRDYTNTFLRWLNDGKVERIIQEATHIVAWNPVVADYARRFNSQVTELSLGFDLERYRPQPDPAYQNQPRPFRIGWIGTPGGYPYLHLIADALRQLSQNYPIELCVISSQPFTLEGINVVNLPWGLETEVRDLLTCDVGIMPLPDSEWASGKSGCKMLQYMAVGVPAIVSPIGINASVIQHNQNGLTAISTAEWYEAFERLIKNPELRRDLGRAGRAYVEQHNNQARNAEKLIAILQQSSSI